MIKSQVKTLIGKEVDIKELLCEFPCKRSFTNKIHGSIKWIAGAVTGHAAWNSLPTHIKNIHTHAFCRHL